MSWTLVTGGAKRLGAAICQELAQKGYNIVVHYRESKLEAEEVAALCREHSVKAEILYGDFSSMDSLEAFTKDYLNRYSDTQHCVHNVGRYFTGSTLATPLAVWQELFQTNLFAAVKLAQAIAPSLKSHQGSLVHLGFAGVGSVKADNYCTAYTSAKQALLMMTKSLAKELASDYVRVNMVSPGYIDNAVDLRDSTLLPMKRAATCHDVARVVAFLIDPASAYITGQNIEIAGGVRL